MSIVVSIDLGTGTVIAHVRGTQLWLTREEAGQLASYLEQALREPWVLESRVGYAGITSAHNPFGSRKYSQSLGT